MVSKSLRRNPHSGYSQFIRTIIFKMILRQIITYFHIYTFALDLQTILFPYLYPESPVINVTNSKFSGQFSDFFSLYFPVCCISVSSSRCSHLIPVMLVCIRAHPQLSSLLFTFTSLVTSCNLVSLIHYALFKLDLTSITKTSP